MNDNRASLLSSRDPRAREKRHAPVLPFLGPMDDGRACILSKGKRARGEVGVLRDAERAAGRSLRVGVGVGRRATRKGSHVETAGGSPDPDQLAAASFLPPSPNPPSHGQRRQSTALLPACLPASARRVADLLARSLQHAAGRQSMGATPGRARAARFYASPSFSPEPESPPSQHEASLPVIQETLVMRDEDEDDEDELDELDVLQSQSADRPHEADEEPQAGGDDDDVDEPADDDAAGATPKGPKLAIVRRSVPCAFSPSKLCSNRRLTRSDARGFLVQRSGHTELSASPSPSSASADDEDDDDPADPALFSPSLTEPSVEAMLDRRAEEQAAALADAAAAALAAAPAPQANAVASSSRAPAADAGAAPPAASAPRPAPRRDFFRGKTFFIAGRRPVKPGPLAEVADIRHAILDAGGCVPLRPTPA